MPSKLITNKSRTSLIKKAKSILIEANQHPDEADLNAFYLLKYVTKKNSLQLVLNDFISDDMYDEFFKLIDQMAITHIPLAYLLKDAPFLNLTLAIEPPILIPRPETEWWVLEAFKLLNPFAHESFRVLDMCTGSGCIGIATALRFPSAIITLADCDHQACILAEKNLKKYALENRINVIQTDLFNSLSPSPLFNSILCNPPYISREEYKMLEVSVRNWEAYHALTDGGDGTFFVKKIIDTAPRYLKKDGFLALEINEHHGKEMLVYLEACKRYKNAQLLYDQYQKPRALVAFTR